MTGHRWNLEPISLDAVRDQAPDRYAPLFEPVRIGTKTAPNRFYSVPYSSGWGMHQINLEIGHRAMRAEGGWGVVATGVCRVSREADSTLAELELFDDDDTPVVARLADAIHEHGSLAGIALGHAGMTANPLTFRVPPVGPSQMQSDAVLFGAPVARAMSIRDIRRVQHDFAAAARRARSAGFDIVYVHAAHSFLAVQFLTPYYNRRTDEYGGSLENRARFLLETLEQVRAELRDDAALACRFSIEGLGQGSIGIEEALEVMRLADHLVDVWDISIGGLANAERDLTPSSLYPEGASLEWSRRAKEATTKPVVGSARFTDVDLMLRVIRSGELDFIGAARPGIADPFLPRKIAAGEFRRIRECIGSNRCASSQFAGTLACSQNPTVGEEYRRGWHPERLRPGANSKEPVLIVGAGPAGMECATALARRGFENVHLVDGAERLGGHLRWYAQLPGFAAWSQVIEHRKAMIEDLREIQFVPSKPMDVDDVLGYGTAIVVIATGSRWATTARGFLDGEPTPGANASLPHVLTPEQLILEGKELPGRSVVVYDCEGDVTGLGVAQHLQARGHDVELASPLADIGMRAHMTLMPMPMRRQLISGGGRLRAGLVLTGVDTAGATFVNEATQQMRVDCDAVMLLTVRSSDDALYQALTSDPGRLEDAGIDAVYRVGDCEAPQNLSEALFSGHRLAREIDTESPEVPLPVPRS